VIRRISDYLDRPVPPVAVLLMSLACLVVAGLAIVAFVDGYDLALLAAVACGIVGLGYAIQAVDALPR